MATVYTLQDTELTMGVKPGNTPKSANKITCTLFKELISVDFPCRTPMYFSYEAAVAARAGSRQHGRKLPLQTEPDLRDHLLVRLNQIADLSTLTGIAALRDEVSRIGSMLVLCAS
jgi:hypothetical protein